MCGCEDRIRLLQRRLVRRGATSGFVDASDKCRVAIEEMLCIKLGDHCYLLCVVLIRGAVSPSVAVYLCCNSSAIASAARVDALRRSCVCNCR